MSSIHPAKAGAEEWNLLLHLEQAALKLVGGGQQVVVLALAPLLQVLLKRGEGGGLAG